MAAEYTVNPTTISKAYGLLELEALIQRNRGKPMTIAALRPNQQALSQRLRQIETRPKEAVSASTNFQ